MSADLSSSFGNVAPSRMPARATMSPGVPPRETAEHDVEYIPRTLRVRRGDRFQGECTDAEFFAEKGPRIILGDPGMGKSRIVKEFAAGHLVLATDIGMYRALREAFPEKIAIDGVDEVSFCVPNRNEHTVIEGLRDFKEANFVLTCRSADWKRTVEEMIYRRWKKVPVVGRLLPLSARKIEQMVRACEPNEETAAKFIEAARQRDAFDMLGNPQHLLMLMDSVERHGWPDSKTELYQSFCEMLAPDRNPVRSESLRADQPSVEEMLRYAGFLFAQMLLSGTERVRATSGPEDIHSIQNTVGDSADTGLAMKCVNSGLFRTGTDGCLQSGHRTVAEYLAGQWLAESLRKEDLSEKDVDALMRVSDNQVPSSLRGLHAWFATHCARADPNVADRRIRHDPYGFWCYGDPGGLNDSSAKLLLAHLAELSRENPRFYGREGRMFIGDWPRSAGLRDHIIRLVEDKDTPAALLRLLVDSIRGKEFVGKVVGTLKGIVLDEGSPPGARHSCLDCLASREGDVDVDGIVRELASQNGIESLSVAVDGIVTHTPRFKGSTIVDVLIAAGVQRHYLGMGQHGVEGKMTVDQLREGLDVVVRATGGERPWAEAQEAGRWVLRFLGKLLKTGHAPGPHEIARLLMLSVRDRGSGGSWDEESRKYFTKHEDVRRAVQEGVIRSLDKHTRFIELFRLGNMSPGLPLVREDLEFQLASLGEAIGDEDVGLWRDLALYGKASGHTEIVESELARRSGQPELREVEREVREFAPAAARRDRQADLANTVDAVSEELESYRRQFKDNRAGIRQGDLLKQLMWAASAYLGFGGIRVAAGDTPVERLVSLVGEDMVDDVILGLERAATNKKHFESARDLAETRAGKKIHWYELVLNAHCHMRVSNGQGLTHLRGDFAKSALAAHQLAYWWSTDEVHAQAIAALEEIVYEDDKRFTQHIRDITEPMLDARESGIAGIALMRNAKNPSKAAGALALEWLEMRSDLDEDNFWSLLATVHSGLGRDSAVTFVRGQTRRRKFPDQALREPLMGAAFALDFFHHRKKLEAFAKESRDHLWEFRDAPANLHGDGFRAKLTVEQCEFLLALFAEEWPKEGYPGWLQVGDRNPWNASWFFADVIETLRGNDSPKASDALSRLAGSAKIDGYLDDVKTAKAHQRRLRTDAESGTPSLPQVRDALVRRAPASHRHLQAQVIERLEELQARIDGDDTDPVEKFWTGARPRPESYCTKRIKEELEHAFQGSGNPKVVTEATMPAEGRADLLCTHTGKRTFSVPIEVKGQWNKDLWDGAYAQLAGYVSDHDAGDTGIYLVLWFGDSGISDRHRVKAPSGGGQRPSTAKELKDALDENHRDIPYRLETFVLDLSGGSKSPRQRRSGKEIKRSAKRKGRVPVAARG